jgi:DNA-binding transcriptional MerR regulator
VIVGGNDMTYSIGEIAEMMEVEPSTLRYYDQMGIFPNIRRVSGRRVFTDEDFKWLRVLKCMKKINMPVKKIQEYVELAQKGDETLEQRYQMILEQKKVIKKEMEELQNCYKEFEYKEWYYKTAIEAGTEKVLENVTSNAPTLDVDIIPQNFKKEG